MLPILLEQLTRSRSLAVLLKSLKITLTVSGKQQPVPLLLQPILIMVSIRPPIRHGKSLRLVLRQVHSGRNLMPTCLGRGESVMRRAFNSASVNFSFLRRVNACFEHGKCQFRAVFARLFGAYNAPFVPVHAFAAGYFKRSYLYPVRFKRIYCRG